MEDQTRSCASSQGFARVNVRSRTKQTHELVVSEEKMAVNMVLPGRVSPETNPMMAFFKLHLI